MSEFSVSCRQLYNCKTHIYVYLYKAMDLLFSSGEIGTNTTSNESPVSECQHSCFLQAWLLWQAWQPFQLSWPHITEPA